MKLLSIFTEGLYKVLLACCSLALAAMVVIIFVQVFCRFILDFTPYWTEELTLIIMIYVGFFGGVIAYKKRLHISLQFFLQSLPIRHRIKVLFIIDCILCIFAVYSVIYGWQLTGKTMNQVNPALGWPVGTSYVAIPISGVVFLIFTLEKIWEGILGQKSIITEN